MKNSSLWLAFICGVKVIMTLLLEDSLIASVIRMAMLLMTGSRTYNKLISGYQCFNGYAKKYNSLCCIVGNVQVSWMMMH